MASKISLHTIQLLIIFLLSVSCSKQEKTEDGIVKVNKNGIPVMMPLQEELPKLSTAFVNDKKYAVSRFFENTWSEKNDNVAFLVAKNGQIIYENYMGFANKRTGEMITKEIIKNFSFKNRKDSLNYLVK
jgi:hypothetical protein